MVLGPDAEESGDERVDGDEEEEGGMYLDANHKRVLARSEWEAVIAGDGFNDHGLPCTAPQERRFCSSAKSIENALQS